MENLTTLIISALMLALVMPISALVLYLVLVRHVSLSDDTAMHAAVLQIFDNEAERAAWHADHQRAIEVRTVRVLAAYNRVLPAELRCLDPVTAEVFRYAMSHERAAEDPVNAEHGSAALMANPAETHPRHASRVALWRRPSPVTRGRPWGRLRSARSRRSPFIKRWRAADHQQAEPAFARNAIDRGRGFDAP